MRRIHAALALTALGVAVPVAAAVQSGDVDASLAAATKAYREKGYSPEGWEQFGTLANATETRVTIPLKGGRSYQIVAACDRKCTDLDLQLFDAAGKEVDWDALDDDFPIVAADVRQSQVYTVRVVMSACGPSPCAFGAKAFVKD